MPTFALLRLCLAALPRYISNRSGIRTVPTKYLLRLFRFQRTVWVCLVLALLGWVQQGTAFAQSNPNLDNGIKAFGSYDVGSIDHVDLATGALSLKIPIASYSQRGSLPTINVEIMYESKAFGINGHCEVPPNGGDPYCEPKWQYVEPFSNTFGAGLIFDTGLAGATPTTLQQGTSGNVYSYTARTADGAAHPLYPSPFVSGAQIAGDGTGFSCQSGCNTNELGTRSVYSRAGIWPNGNSTEDPNGNQMSAPTDSLGRAVPGSTSTAPDSTGCAGDFPTLSAEIQNIPGYNGSTQQIKLCYTQLYIKTAFNDSTYEDQYGFTSPWKSGATVTETGGLVNSILQTVLLYDGNSWSTSPSWVLHYNNGLNGTSVTNYGDLTEITLPTGGTIQYSYTTASYCDMGYPGFVNMSRSVISRTENANDGSAPIVTTYNSGTVNDGANDTVHTFTEFGSACQMYETGVQYYTGSGNSRTLLKTVTTDYNSSPDPYDNYYTDTASRVIGVMPIRTTTTLPNGLVSKVEQDYQTATAGGGASSYVVSTGNVVQKREYDWGNGSPGALIRCTATTYQSQVNSSYMAANLLDLPASVSVYSGSCNSGTLMSQDTYKYDESSLMSSGVTVQRDPGASSLTVRGNPTSHARWLNTTGTTITERDTYYDTGEKYQHIDFKNNPATTYYYDNAYAGGSLTKTQWATTGSIAHTVSAGYDLNTGLITSYTDENSHQSTYSYDNLARVTNATYPGGGCTQLTYTSFTSVQKTVCMNPAQSVQTTTNFDGLGRPVNKILSEGSSQIYTRTAYDAQGRKAQVWNPSRCDQRTATSCSGETTWGSTRFQYDGLGRQTLLIPPDGTATTNNEVTIYPGNTVLVTDEMGNQWQRTSDALGRLTKVLEPLPSTAPNIETDYAYDVLNNITGVNQKGASSETPRQRSFTYDSLSRLITSTNPETGTICYGTWSGGSVGSGTCQSQYGYDANSNLVKKTDARGIVTSYSYDILDRILSKTYSNDPSGTLSSCYQYDSSTYALTNPNLIGRLANSWTQSGACPAAPPSSGMSTLDAVTAYDLMGRISNESTCTPGSSCSSLSNSVSALYDYAGNMTSLGYPDGRTVSQSFDSAARLSNVAYTSWNGNSVSNQGYLTVPTGGYDPAGHLVSATYGNGISMSVPITAAYDSRERIHALAYGATSSPVWSKAYTYSSNSNLLLATDNVQGLARQFTYDTLNRLTSAQDIAGTVSSSGETASSNDGSQDNALSSPQYIDGSMWGMTNATIVQNSAIAPDGSMTALTMTANSGSTNSYINAVSPTPTLFDGATATGKVWLKVPSGTLTTNVWIVDNTTGFVGTPLSVNLTTTWQQFTIPNVVLKNGLTYLSLEVGSNGTITAGQSVNVWGPELNISSAPDTNLLPSSQQAGAAGWSVANGTVQSNSVTAPDGSKTAATLVPASGSTDTYLVDDVVSPAQFSSTTVTGSVYLSASSGTPTINIYVGSAGPSGTQTYSTLPVTLSSTWQRFVVTQTTQAGLTRLFLQIGGATSLEAGQTINVWGAQMVVGSSAGSYVATTDTTTGPTGATEYLAANGLNEHYYYDSFGNLQQTGNITFEQSYTSANQLSGWSYDASGNMLSDGVNNGYVYDANSMVASLNGTSYIYDAAGDRVAKTGSGATTTVYFGGKPIARYAGSAWTDLIYGVGGILAEVPGSQAALPSFYRMADHLGSSAGTLSSTGAVLSIEDYAPFGQVFTGSNLDPYKFTGKERDTESGLDYFGARYYGSSIGRFMSPDWSAKREAVPYAKLANPQSLNLYAYMNNNPLLGIDPDGHSTATEAESTACAAANASGNYCSSSQPDLGTEQDRFTAVLRQSMAQYQFYSSTPEEQAAKVAKTTWNDTRAVAKWTSLYKKDYATLYDPDSNIHWNDDPTLDSDFIRARMNFEYAKSIESWYAFAADFIETVTSASGEPDTVLVKLTNLGISQAKWGTTLAEGGYKASFSQQVSMTEQAYIEAAATHEAGVARGLWPPNQ